MQYWLIRPPQFDASKKYPVVFMIHGGPQGSFNDAWSFRWNPRVFASQGYAVVSIDFHGSTGYGQAFTDSINRDWGGKPLEDLKLGLEAALATHPQLDGTRACALGASYGGYMMNWIQGQWPDRFKCLVNHDGVFDNRMMGYATEELWFTEWEQGGTPYDVPKNYEQFNPVNHVKDWKIPTLVVMGERNMFPADLAATAADVMVTQFEGEPIEGALTLAGLQVEPAAGTGAVLLHPAQGMDGHGLGLPALRRCH